MKKLLISGASILALGVTPALAVDNVFIQQFNNDVKATVDQTDSRDGAAFIVQIGDTSGGGSANPAPDAEVKVTQKDAAFNLPGFTNEAHVLQDVGNVDQPGDLKATINQDQTDAIFPATPPNKAFVLQIEGNNVSSNDIVASITQKGEGNTAIAVQRNLATSGSFGNIGITTNQDGDDNTSNARQLNSKDSDIKVVQIGDDNESTDSQERAFANSDIDVKQDGDRNEAENAQLRVVNSNIVVRQNGNDDSTTNNQTDATDSNINVTQSGNSFNEALNDQTNTDNSDIIVVQSGSNNFTDNDQVDTTDSDIKVTQTDTVAGEDNVSFNTQMNTNNSDIIVSQFGDDNVAGGGTGQGVGGSIALEDPDLSGVGVSVPGIPGVTGLSGAINSGLNTGSVLKNLLGNLQKNQKNSEIRIIQGQSGNAGDDNFAAAQQVSGSTAQNNRVLIKQLTDDNMAFAAQINGSHNRISIQRGVANSLHNGSLDVVIQRGSGNVANVNG